MNVLLTNDDGINGEGLISLKEALEAMDGINLTVVAPDRERSASSHRITIFDPLILKEVSDKAFTLNGSPADCVKISLEGLLKEQIDLVVSGINNGPNMGIDVYYSGTVAAAREARFHSIPSIAFSIDGYTHDKAFDTATEWAVGIVMKVLEQPIRAKAFYNVNIPNVKKGLIKGIQITSLGKRVYNDQVLERITPFGWKYFWIGGDLPSYQPEENSDFNAVEDNYVSLTPLQLDVTDYSAIEDLKGNFNLTF